ncbi:unnamed protein product [Rotaria sordida]|uniref:Uncharacterized protein n=1 Tax=Rotaria sordida TaxID=392033 RepID=A0A814VAX2_9BILA|nr:unnamed protein product [Rotaria sordida]CAF1387604.1 unnamed protein product [Rotaria sordida]
MLATTVQQGAGLVNAFQALTATTIISPSELALNDTVRQKKFYNIKISNVDEKVAHIPYAGVVGDYKNARILVRNSSTGLVTGLANGNGFYISNGEYLNLTKSGVFPVLVMAWASRIVIVDVISGKDNVPHSGFNSG